jgi:hypothetical protein
MSPFGKPGPWKVTFTTETPKVNIGYSDFWSDLGMFLIPIFQGIEAFRILRCAKCGRYEFTNKKKKEPQCNSCVTKGRVQRWRKSNKLKYGKGLN